MKKQISEKTIQRLFLYHRYLYFLVRQGGSQISSKELAKFLGTKDSQVRKDLSYFGRFGTKGSGYDVLELREEITKILKVEKESSVCLVGMGSLGSALAGYRVFEALNFKIVAVFDNSPQKIGRKIRGHYCYDVKELPKIVKKNRIKIGIITTPAESAQEAARLLEGSGIQAILNFAPVKLSLSKTVQVRNLDMAMELKTLSFFIS